VRLAITLEQCWHRVPGGTGVYGVRLADALAHHGGIDVVGVAGRHRKPPTAGFSPTVPVRALPLAGPFLYESWLRFGWPKVEGATGAVDLVHATSIIPAATSHPLVVTVHDLAFLHDPSHFTPRGVSVFTRSLEIVKQRAARVVCVSQTTLEDCLDHGFSEAQVRHVPNGVSHVRVSPERVDEVRRVHGLPSSYLLFVGTLEPRKNLDRLVRAVDTLGDDLPPLVVVGAAGWGEGVVPSPKVKMLGFVPADHLPALYAGATAFCYPSLREGFGLPILEAMSQGAPVVTSRGSSTEEVAGGAAVLVDPADVASIADGILRALEDRERWSQAGLARSRSMTWEATAARTIDVYREVLQ
jgi:glycosyltransferase involved in cell wall biosynthesis